MNDVQILFGQFIHTLENRNSKKNDLELARSFYKEIKQHEDEIRHPVDLEELLRSSKTKKEKKCRLIMLFYDFVKEKTGVGIETDLDTKLIIDDPQERRIAVIRYMQTNPIDIDRIADLFMMSDKSMRELLNELEDGVDILGTKVKIKMDRDGSNRYSVISYHPIFMNLTMPEVVALTVGLVDAAKNNELYAPVFRKIAKEVYENLTEYGKGCIARMPKSQDVESVFLNEIQRYEENISISLMTMLKEGYTGNIQIQSEGKDYVFTSCKVIDYGCSDIVLATRDGKERCFKISEVFGCEYFGANRLRQERD